MTRAGAPIEHAVSIIQHMPIRHSAGVLSPQMHVLMKL